MPLMEIQQLKLFIKELTQINYLWDLRTLKENLQVLMILKSSKNYLSEEELMMLNYLVFGYFDFVLF